MTRINLVDPAILKPDHFAGEYTELPRVFTLVLNAQNKGKIPADFKIPPKFTLNKGHVTFFYDKLSFLHKRYLAIIREAKNRNINVNYRMVDSILAEYHTDIHSHWKGEYTPTHEDIYLSMSRLVTMSKIDTVYTELNSFYSGLRG